jgi:xylitol oxidase
VFEGLGWEALVEHFDAITSAGSSVSLFTRWGPDAGALWVKGRRPVPAELLGIPAATEDRHPIPGMDPVNCSRQLGAPGPWYDRLPHFRMGFTPSAGAELQSEYLVPRRHALAAIDALRGLAGAVAPLLMVSEIRTIAADRLWMSPQHGRDTVAIHFTWKPEQVAVERVCARLEAALAPFGARPHWGKLFLADASVVAPLYPRHADFARLARRLDPRGAFTNAWLEERVLGSCSDRCHRAVAGLRHPA